MFLVVFYSLLYLLSRFPSSEEPSCSSSTCSWCGFLHPDLPLSAAFNCVFSPRVRNKTCFHLRAPHFQLFLLLFVFSGSNNFVPFLILCNNYGSAMLQIFSSPRLYFVFSARLSLIIHRQRMENFTAICSCWMNPSYCFVSRRQNSSDGSFVVLNVIWLLLWQATYHGGEGHVQSNALSSCVAPNRRRSPSGILWDAVCSYLCLITSDVLFRLFAFDQAAAELFRKSRRRRRQGKLLATRFQNARPETCSKSHDGGREGPDLLLVLVKSK